MRVKLYNFKCSQQKYHNTKSIEVPKQLLMNVLISIGDSYFDLIKSSSIYNDYKTTRILPDYGFITVEIAITI